MWWFQSRWLLLAIGRLNMVSGHPWGVWWAVAPKDRPGRYASKESKYKAAVWLPCTALDSGSRRYARLCKRLGLPYASPRPFIAFKHYA